MGFEVELREKLQDSLPALPTGFNVDRFVQNGVALIQGNKSLMAYVQNHGTGQLKSGMMKAAFLGLDFMNKEAYLIPYGEDLNFMIDYRGSTKLAKKYSIRPIKDIYAKIVRKGDEFEETIVNGEPTINFKPIPFNNDEIIGAFAVCQFADGGIQYDVMSIAELNVSRSKSKASNSMAWKDFPGEMYKKTVLHRLCKHIEIDFENAEQTKIFNADTDMEVEDVKQEVKNEIIENANAEVLPNDF